MNTTNMSIPTPTYAADKDDECAICLRPLYKKAGKVGKVGKLGKLGKPLQKLCCGHVFHYFCCIRMRNQMCPVCRTSMAETHVCDLLHTADEDEDEDEDEDGSIVLCQELTDVIDTVIDGDKLVIAEGVHQVLLRLDEERVCVESTRGDAGGFTRLDVLRAVFKAWGGREDTVIHTLVRLGNGDYKVKYDS